MDVMDLITWKRQMEQLSSITFMGFLAEKRIFLFD
jgi:hypothetical protein